MRYGKRQEVQSTYRKKKSIDTVLEEAQALVLLSNIHKSYILNIFKDLKYENHVSANRKYQKDMKKII